MPVRSGPMLVPSPLWTWHLAQFFMKTTLPASASPVSFGQRQQLIDHLLPIGIGQGAARASRVFAWPPMALVGMIGQRLLLIERQIAELELALSTAASSAFVHVGPAQQDAQAGGAAGGVRRRQTLENASGRHLSPRVACSASQETAGHARTASAA